MVAFGKRPPIHSKVRSLGPHPSYFGRLHCGNDASAGWPDSEGSDVVAMAPCPGTASVGYVHTVAVASIVPA